MVKLNLPNDVGNVIFDLDGTIIDSVDSILWSLDFAFKTTGIRPLVDLNSKLIGPPLSELITTASGIGNNSPKYNSIKFQFQQHYDSLGYLNTKVFPGVIDDIINLNFNKKNIFIATNKRRIPTMKILELFNVLPYIKKVYTLDSFNPVLLNKTELLGSLVKHEKLLPGKCVFIGDRRSDEKAALVMNMNYIMVPWGYEP
jgi:phosphoglycolate phosphatase